MLYQPAPLHTQIFHTNTPTFQFQSSGQLWLVMGDYTGFCVDKICRDDGSVSLIEIEYSIQHVPISLLMLIVFATIVYITVSFSQEESRQKKMPKLAALLCSFAVLQGQVHKERCVCVLACVRVCVFGGLIECIKICNILFSMQVLGLSMNNSPPKIILLSWKTKSNRNIN